MNPLLEQLTHRPFPEVAEIIRCGADQITHDWDVAVRFAMPQMQRLTFDELKDSTPQILRAISQALASDDPDMIGELVSCSPKQGLSRLRLNFDLIEVMQEDRLLRSITVAHVNSGLGRRMELAESAALHAAIDIMLQRSVIALVDQQKTELRSAAETELKFLSFLSHDLNNNLNSITMSLESLGMDLRLAGGFDEAEHSLSLAQQQIYDTVAGMRRMLDHARLRKPGEGSTLSRVNLHALAMRVVTQFSQEAEAKGVRFDTQIMLQTFIESDGELLSLVLQNLIGNAVKYSSEGAVTIGFGRSAEEGPPMIWVSDQGPGIAAEKMEHIFEAFRRGEIHGQQGVGLGLAIASQAAKLLGAALAVESRLGVGSTFRLTLPEKG
jgi:signal transduction histidine kinase